MGGYGKEEQGKGHSAEGDDIFHIYNIFQSQKRLINTLKVRPKSAIPKIYWSRPLLRISVVVGGDFLTSPLIHTERRIHLQHNDESMNFYTRKWVNPEDLNAHGTPFAGTPPPSHHQQPAI